MAQQKTNAEWILKDLSKSDPAMYEKITSATSENMKESGLDQKTYSLVNIAALITENAAPASYLFRVANAKKAGVKDDEIAGLLVALAPTIGMAKVVSAAPKIGFALGYEISEYQK